MPERPRKKRPADLNKRAWQIVQEAVGEAPRAAIKQAIAEGKDPAAVMLGRKGGLKGGKARAAKMTPEERSESARRAAQARWSKSEER